MHYRGAPHLTMGVDEKGTPSLRRGPELMSTGGPRRKGKGHVLPRAAQGVSPVAIFGPLGYLSGSGHPEP